MTLIAVAVIAVILFALFLKIHSRHKEPSKAALANMFLGVLSLIFVAPLVSASVNFCTVFTSLTLGLPGTTLVAIMSLI
ncbi:MAG: hypothetical protein FWG83_02485 [Oscillospiraceae bacterium]|nr:hypothetical protein [Oscillospiraceae bacterium]